MGKFKKGDWVVVNTTKYDDSFGKEYGSKGIVNRYINGSVRVDFAPGANNNEFETWGTYDEEDLRHLNKLERILK